MGETPWDRIEFGPGGCTLDAYCLSGLEECFGLAGVETLWTEAGLHAQVLTGMVPEVAVCQLPNEPYVSTVELDEPIITGGH